MLLRMMLLTAAALFSTQSIAMFCPTSFNSMELGNTAAQVEAQCGKPAEVKKYKSTSNMPQEWTYFMQIDPNSQATMKVTIAFIDNKINNITANGSSVGATSICNKTNIQLSNKIQYGDSTERVEKACGKPAMVSQLNLTGSDDQQVPKPVEFEEWIYTTSPPVTLVFQNGILKERK